MSTWSDLMLQNGMSPLMEQLIFFHDHTLMIIIMITIMVTYIIMTMMYNKFINRYLLEGQLIELIWTMMPALTLMFIALPSLKLLYLLDEINEPMITVKSIGHQWYWSYELSDFKNIEFDSYMESYKMIDQFRLLDVDNRLILPFNSKIRLIVCSMDVIHSWTIPSLGVKIDALPGRLNQMGFIINRPGIIFGQCSEICGTNHSFMPITIESVKMSTFIKWLKSY
uniref:Cytochrome c oxidase subunit 2 n=3 Tax=Cosmoscarta TaxID=130642 RepID=A0A0U1YM25_9HEMI|nr:cytochrome c oxidase subunit II [Cosmoscarta bispecularis]AZL35840.1 cytochrome c oxidase subunit II [Cosmoscarta bispecularis]QHR79670.1 cytochrome c oxidase subunit 2 [Cosmoscarta dorsimacula]